MVGVSNHTVFFPLLVDVQQQPAQLTFAHMAATVALLTLLSYPLSGHVRRHPALGRCLQQLTGAVLLAFGLPRVSQK